MIGAGQSARSVGLVKLSVILGVCTCRERQRGGVAAELGAEVWAVVNRAQLVRLHRARHVVNTELQLKNKHRITEDTEKKRRCDFI